MSNETTAITVTPKQRFDDLMERLTPKIKDVLPHYLTPERMTKLMMVEAQKKPAIYDCLIQTPRSVISAFMLAAELGLEIGDNRGFIHLIPRYMKDPMRDDKKFMQLTTMIGYRGYVEMAKRSGAVEYISAGVVYRDEVESGAFQWKLGDSEGSMPFYDHVGSLAPKDAPRNDAAIVLAYAYAKLVGGGSVLEVLDRDAIEKRRRKASSQKFWNAWYDRMARKTAIRALLNGGLVPLTAPMQKAVAWENDQDVSLIENSPAPADAPTVIEADPIRVALEMDNPGMDPDPAPVETPATTALDAEIADLEEKVNEAGIAEARAAVGDAPFDDTAGMTKYRDELAKRVGGES